MRYASTRRSEKRWKRGGTCSQDEIHILTDSLHLRINYDAAVTALEKVQANKKAKDKDRNLAEDEVVKAKLK